MKRLSGLWRGEAGGREVLDLGLPLILSMMSVTLQHFVDRIFLTWWSTEAVAGVTTAGFAIYVLTGLFNGTAEYATPFVSQYVGAKREDRIGAVVYQAAYFAALAGLLGFALSYLAAPLFNAVGHAPSMREHEIAYSRILLRGTFPVVLMVAFSTYFAGRGRTKIVLGVTMAATLLNVGLDWLLIFGKFGAPALGTVGAAYATNVSQAIGALIYLVLILGAKDRIAHGFLDFRFQPALFFRLLKLGVPSGLQPSLEILAFTLFLFVIGNIGVEPLAATSIAFNLNGMVFLPAIGLGYGVSTLVARYLGMRRPDLADRAVKSGLVIAEMYMIVCSSAYVLMPGWLLAPYAVGADPATFAEVSRITTILLRFVAFYSIFDMVNVVCAGGLKGAGDTRFPVTATVVISWVAMLLPTWWFCVRGHQSVFVAWVFVTLYVVILGVVLFVRYRKGAWKGLRIIESDAPPAVELA
ncbi:MAG: MATE family efflux transporter [Vicinamibacteria bacterium]|nr:MATE family efflux transporter [Vicinamibacteria bacterium]